MKNKRMTHKILRVVGVLCVFLIVVFAVSVYMKRSTPPTITLDGKKIVVEVASTQEQMQRGLSGRVRINKNRSVEGMLFVLQEETIPSFWMKDMQFSLDFIWIYKNTVVDITEHVPAPKANTPDAELTIYRPKAVVTHVLEVPAGFVQEHEIKIGARVNE